MISSSKDDEKNSQGVPQGLSISNILAAIYLQSLDSYLAKIEGARCYRYVDDILVLCDKSKSESISSDIIKKFDESNLEIHCPIKKPHKSMIGDLKEGFDYLGYVFGDDIVSVKQGSIDKLKASLVGIFTSYKYSEKPNQDFLAWRINIRITGCIFENKSKGWLFFFSEITDESLLHKLDYFVYKLCQRFDVDIEPKKFVKAFKEISHRKYVTKYVPNFDSYNVQDMGKVLSTYFVYNLKGMREDQIKYAFYKKVSKQIKDLEADIKDFSASG